MARYLRQICRECGSEAIITKTDRVHLDISKVYCQCKNPECGHSWACDLLFSHTLKQSKISKNGLLFHLLDKLPVSDLKDLQKFVGQKLENA